MKSLNRLQDVTLRSSAGYVHTVQWTEMSDRPRRDELKRLIEIASEANERDVRNLYRIIVNAASRFNSPKLWQNAGATMRPEKR